MRYLLLVLFLWSAIGIRADDNKNFMSDGFFWNSLSDDAKLHFIQGYISGYDTGAAQMFAFVRNNNKTAASSDAYAKTHYYSGDGIAFETVVKGIDKCYSDFRNDKLEVAVCMNWAVKGVKGENNAARERFLESARKLQPPE
jgi:hypothetical protein